MGDGTDVTGQKYSFTRISLSVNDINIRVKLNFFYRTHVNFGRNRRISLDKGSLGD